MTCKICSSKISYTVYTGPIRDGRWPKLSADYYIIECENCKAQSLPYSSFKTADYYTSGEYDRQVREPVEDMRPYQRHLDVVLNKTTHRDSLLDVGGGLGAFSELASHHFDAVAGYEVGEQAPTLNPSVITSFNVIEHVEDPLLFLKSAYDLLPPGGQIVICTPNRDNILMEISDPFKSFFYRTQHNWYFDSASLLELMFYAGFNNCSHAWTQNYHINNTFGWLINGEPSKDYEIPVDNLEPTSEKWAETLTQQGLSDTVYVYGRKPE